MDKNVMALAMRLTGLVCLSSALSLAESWSGALVDSGCWESEKDNTRSTSVYVDRDGDRELRFCAPKAKTKSFAVVLSDGRSLKLDAAGNARAVALIQKTDKKNPVTVVVNGEASKNVIKVDSISAAKK
jgi:hypothetical protein